MPQTRLYKLSKMDGRQTPTRGQMHRQRELYPMRLLKAIHSQKTERGRRGGSRRETTESENRDIRQERSINLQLEGKKRRDLSDRKQNKEEEHRRRSEGHQGSADHDEVQNVPQVTEVSPGVEQQSQVDHLHVAEGTHRESLSKVNRSFFPSAFHV
ncbi:hypothetical protein EYF80_030076 [Liparis tanakae]|uniref:Uncharacterized protein n=1 Tax=Liparis tanakae TaxID=230148 RepID=A0A4Z2H329_9TELE|nr:hypothetical protein EYF80_030076 [Liparis tanakae]